MDKYRFKFGADEYGKYVDEYKNGKRISCVPGINDIEWVKHEDIKGLELQIATLTEQLSKMERAMNHQTTSQDGYIVIDMPNRRNAVITYLSKNNSGRTIMKRDNDSFIKDIEIIETIISIGNQTGIKTVAGDPWELQMPFKELLKENKFKIIETKYKNSINWYK